MRLFFLDCSLLFALLIILVPSLGCEHRDEDSVDDDTSDDDTSDDDTSDDDTSDDDTSDDDTSDDDTSDDDSDPAIRVYPDEVSLTVSGNEDGAAIDVFVHNDGGSTLVVQVTEPQPPFELIGLVTPIKVLPGSSFNFAVLFTPPETGVFQDVLVFISNDPENMKLIIPCTGNHY